jgi:hypothetical protein
LAALHRAHGRSDCGSLLTSYDQIDGHMLHRVAPEDFSRCIGCRDTFEDSGQEP